MNHFEEKYKVIVIGAGQAGLSVGYYLKKNNIPFIILDSGERVGDSWRNRWDSLRLFTPAKFDGLAGMKFPASPNHFPTKDEMADYLENYSIHFKLPVQTGIKVTGLSRKDNFYCISAGDRQFHAEHVVIAMSSYQIPRIPKFAKEIDHSILQFHSLDYHSPSQFREGGVLVVGAGNSGAEIALEAAGNGHSVWLAGRDNGHIPFNIEGTLAKLILARIVGRILFHRVLSLSTPVGKKVRPKIISRGGPLVRIKPKEFIKAGIKRVPKVSGVRNGLPLVEDEPIADVKNVVWCTGFYPSFSWIDIPVFKNNDPVQNRGVVEKEPGLYFVGLHFQYSYSSGMIHGLKRDAGYVVKIILSHLRSDTQQASSGTEPEKQKPAALYEQKSKAV